ncbi:MAG: Ferric enterobactin receptor precursor [Sphingobacteriales bacterium]|nr:Ferric enterobactin receptor precursor [Sphingobacteriales bacterium]
MKYLLLLFFFQVFAVSSNAQIAKISGKAKISGTITDASTKQPVDYATITIYNQGSKIPVNGTTSDTKGSFNINGLPVGDYEITVDFIGYQRFTIDHAIISSTNQNIQLAEIKMKPSQNQLQEVIITGQANRVENKIDKLVYNAANDLTSQGGLATDVLKKVPMVTVDIDGNVELQGNSNVRFLINGKPSSIFGASLADALQSIPASQIKSVEVITSPGAKYDASGTGGIINILLKDNKVEGINGTVNASAGTRLQNGSLNLNIKKGSFGISASFSGNAQLNSITTNTLDKESFDNSRSTVDHLFQTGNSEFKRSGYQSGLNLNWSITKRDELSASLGFNHFGNNNTGTTLVQQNEVVAGKDPVSFQSNRNSDNHFSSRSTDYSLAYKKTFKKEDEEFSVVYTASSSKNLADFSQEQRYFADAFQPSGLQSINPGRNSEKNLSLDYSYPLNKKTIFETGVKAISEKLNSSTIADTLTANGNYIPNQNQTHSFNYSRNIYAAYLSLSFSLFKDFITGKSGLRYERTNTKADFEGTNIPGYNIFAPSFVLSHKIDDSQSIKASFTYRLERPDYGDLNPFYNISDPHNINTGNPNLKPELGHNYELGYNKNFGKGANVYIAGFYRYNTEDIQSYTTFYPLLTINGIDYPNVSLNQRYNVGSEVTTGASLFASVPLSQKLNLRSNLYFGDRINKNPGNPTVSGLAYRINLNASYSFGHNLTAEGFINYNSSQKTIQGSRPAFSFYNVAVRKQILNKKVSLGLTAANPFNQYVNQKSTASAANFNQSSIRLVPFRSFGISASYKFGKLEFKKGEEKDSNQGAPQPSE